ncbi:MAG: hypothetical protein ACLP8S_11955 [Solirubrobacteraceae bacterium]
MPGNETAKAGRRVAGTGVKIVEALRAYEREHGEAKRSRPCARHVGLGPCASFASLQPFSLPNPTFSLPNPKPTHKRAKPRRTRAPPSGESPAPRETPSAATSSPTKPTSAPSAPSSVEAASQRAERIEERAREDRATLERQLDQQCAARQTAELERGQAQTALGGEQQLRAQLEKDLAQTQHRLELASMRQGRTLVRFCRV